MVLQQKPIRGFRPPDGMTENSPNITKKTFEPPLPPHFRDLREDKLISRTRDEKGDFSHLDKLILALDSNFFTRTNGFAWFSFRNCCLDLKKYSSPYENFPLFVLRTKYIDDLHKQVRNPYLDFLELGFQRYILEKESFSTFANTEFMNNMQLKNSPNIV